MGNALPTIFTSAVSSKNFDQPENLTPVWKCVETDFPYIPYVNNRAVQNNTFFLNLEVSP